MRISRIENRKSSKRKKDRNPYSLSSNNTAVVNVSSAPTHTHHPTRQIAQSSTPIPTYTKLLRQAPNVLACQPSHRGWLCQQDPDPPPSEIPDPRTNTATVANPERLHVVRDDVPSYFCCSRRKSGLCFSFYCRKRGWR